MSLLRPLALLLLLLAWPFLAVAQSPADPIPGKPDIQTRLLIGARDASDPHLVWAGLDVRLGKGWKTYWRSPGDGGLPPELDWSRSSNLEQPTMLWPQPHRLSILGIESFGYTDHVLFPIALRLKDDTASAHVGLNLALYVCSTICVRDEQQLEADITPAAGNLVNQALIQDARSHVPSRTSSDRLELSSVGVAEGDAIVVRAHARGGFDEPDVFVEWPEGVVLGKPQVHITDDGQDASFTLALPARDRGHALGKPVTITLMNGPEAIERQGQLGVVPAAAEDMGLGPWILGVAFLGGLILNLMPCVLPVLSLKLMSVVRVSARPRRRIREGFAATAAGIVVSFLLLAATMMALKASGAVVGWGIQFQQPLFLTAMTLLLTLFGANLLGLFEIALPVGIGGGSRPRGDSLIGEFGTGFIATLLATPCSAPFVGTAVGFALARGPAEILSIFGALGLGMAVPYMAAAAVPGIVRFVPRPGRWMIWLRRVLGLLLLGSTVWLLSVIAGVAGSVTALIVAAALVVILAVMAVRHRMRGSTRLALSSTAAALAAALLAAQPVLGWLLTPPPAGALSTEWRSFDEQGIGDLVDAGRTVLVDVTAAWCITCKVNERLVLEQNAIVRRLDDDVVPMRADWTRPNEAIANFLKSHGRYGIPFNIVYGPRAPHGIVLPELLSVDVVLRAIDAASARPQPQTGIALDGSGRRKTGSRLE